MNCQVVCKIWVSGEIVVKHSCSRIQCSEKSRRPHFMLCLAPNPTTALSLFFCTSRPPPPLLLCLWIRLLKQLYKLVSFTSIEHTDVGVAVKQPNKPREKIPSEAITAQMSQQPNPALSSPSTLWKPVYMLRMSSTLYQSVYSKYFLFTTG